MKESILHYVWQFRLFQKDLKTTSGETVEVINVGVPNPKEGPDFLNAKVKIDGKVWAGDIQIYHSSADRKSDKHHSGNSVILHVVENADFQDENEKRQIVPQCEIKYPAFISENYEFLIHSNTSIPCCNFIGSLPSLHLNSWLNNLLFERLERKANQIKNLLDHFDDSWEDVFYVLLSRNFGFGLNSESFEKLALSIPLKYIQKQADDIVQIEALLFGQANMLDITDTPDDYYRKLQKEYEFLSNKYNLKPIDTLLFKSMRNRPSAFPQIRIAQLAKLLHNSQGLFSKIIACKDPGRIRLMFHINASEYWQTHYNFGTVSEKKSKYLGDSSLDVILINTIAPMLFAYGKKTNDESLCERAIDFLETLNPEKNSITRNFSNMNVMIRNAADSQGAIQLKREYCEQRKCLSCRVGHQFLKVE